MSDRTPYLTKTIFVATCLAAGCTSSGNLGCGSSDEGPGTPNIESKLVGIYTLDAYHQSEVGACDTFAHSAGPSRVAF